MVQNIVTLEKLNAYFLITSQALDKAKVAFDSLRQTQAEDFFMMASSYFKDARYFADIKEDYVVAFAALNYAHGWLDAGARIGLFQVKDSRLFTVDE